MKIKFVDSMEEFLEWQEFFMEGYRSMNSEMKSNMGVEPEQFLKTSLMVLDNYITTLPKPNAGIIIVASDNGQKLAYGMAMEDTEVFSAKRALLLYGVYVAPNSEGRLKSKAASAIMEACEHQARLSGFSYLKSYTGRFSGATFRWYEEILGMRRHKTLFRKDL